MVKDIVPGFDGSFPYPFTDNNNFSILNGNLVFIAYVSTYGYELWKTDGTEAGTELELDIYPGIYSGLGE